jgi:ABC-type transporter Mla subunit MlaD
VGDAVIDLIPPGDASAEVIAGEGEVYPVVIRSLVGDLTEQFNARLGRFEQTAESLETLARTYDDVGRRLAEVIDSPEPGVRDLRTTIDEVDRFAADSRALVDDVRETAEVWKASAAEITDQSRRLTDRAGQTLGTMDSAAAELREIAARLNRGEGTLGQLATNPDLFRSLQTAAEELRGLLRDARLLVEKYRDEGLPVNIF